ncbi:hypothetical protein HYU19_03220 [Candidatus Woesearchaeota archaeon]|nr:hypothetical protein [Candidatus Woesearchaeota archaeon]
MKLTKIKGIAHDLANHLDFQIWFGYYQDIQKDVITDVTQNKDSFDAMCVEFFKERLPTSFDFKRINKITVEIHRSMTSLNVKVEVKVDDKEVIYTHKSMMS